LLTNFDYHIFVIGLKRKRPSSDDEAWNEFMAWKEKKKEEEEEEDCSERSTSEEEDDGPNPNPSTSAYSQFQNEMLRFKGFDNMIENQKLRTAKRRTKFQPSKGRII